jgi:hypothetical protein
MKLYQYFQYYDIFPKVAADNFLHPNPPFGRMKLARETRYRFDGLKNSPSLLKGKKINRGIFLSREREETKKKISQFFDTAFTRFDMACSKSLSRAYTGMGVVFSNIGRRFCKDTLNLPRPLTKKLPRSPFPHRNPGILWKYLTFIYRIQSLTKLNVDDFFFVPVPNPALAIIFNPFKRTNGSHV